MKHQSSIPKLRHLALVLAMGLPGSARAAEPQVADKDMPRFAPIEAKDAVATMKVRQGFKVELAACEPDVVDPVAIAFDENGRMFVVEMRDYPEKRQEKLGRIRLLEDRDGDGIFETSTIFAQGLSWPTAIFCWNGGIFVAATPDILYLKDTTGDGKADERKVIYTGFAAGMTRINMQALLNSFNWGLDNRIYGAASFNGGKVSRVGVDGTTLDLRGKGFAFDPRSLDIYAENGGGQHGLSFDDWGRMYVCSNSHHIQTFAYDAEYAGGQGYQMPPPLLDIAVDGPAAEVYRISPEEPWRIIRTRWRVSGLVPGPVEGGGRSAGYFTGSTGVTIYRGNAYGPDLQGDAFIGDVGGNLVHRKKLTPDGVVVRAERSPGEEKREFLASTDTWFRPVQFANAPDGCLYVIDMYRQTIEHPWSLPDSLKQHLDLYAGTRRGRIYRIVPDGFKRPAPPRLGSASIEQLVSTLAHPNGWHRDTAARLIYQRQDKAAIKPLEQLLVGPSALGRMHALYALQGLGALQPMHVLRAMSDTDPHLRVHGVRLAEAFLTSAPIISRLGELASDPSIDVRYQLALTLGSLDNPSRPTWLAQIAARTPTDPWIEAAILHSIGDQAVALFNAAHHASLRNKLAGIIGERGAAGEQAQVLASIQQLSDPIEQMQAAHSLAQGQRRAGAEFVQEKLLESARKLAADSKAPLQARIAAIGLMGCTNWSSSANLLLPLLDARQPQEIQLSAVSALDQLDQGDLAPHLLKRWSEFSPALKETVTLTLVKRPARARLLLEMVQAGKIRASEISAANASLLHHSRDPQVKNLAARVLATAPGQRQAVVQRFLPALSLAGNAARGHEVYVSKCASCHRSGKEGSALGPDFETVRNWDSQRLLTNILDPNLEVAPNYSAYILETKQGDTQMGIIIAETSSSVTLRMAYANQITLARRQIKSLRSTGTSMMPEGLEEGLGLQDLADLIAFLRKE